MNIPDKTTVEVMQPISVAFKALKISLMTKGRISALVSILGFGAAFIPAGISMALRIFSDNIQSLYSSEISIKKVCTSLFVLMGLYLIQSLYQAVSSYYTEIDKISVNRFIKKTVMDCAATVEFRYIENEGDFRDKLSFMEMFGGERVAGSMNLVISIIHEAVTFISLAVVLVFIQPWLLVILMVTCIPSVVLSIMQNDENYKHNTKNMKEAAMSVHLFYIAAGAQQHCKSMNTVRFSCAYPWLKEKWRKVSYDFIDKKRLITRKHVRWNIIADCLRNGVYIWVLLVATYQIYINPTLGIGLFMAVYQLSKQFQVAATKMLTQIATFFGDIPYMKDFFDLQDTPRELVEEQEKRISDAKIVCQNLCFSYPNSDKEVLHNISITINQGEKIAIVGQNGSGKSTFVNLLCGMYQPVKGSVTIGGNEVSNALCSIRGIMSVVFQNFGRYESSLRRNIEVGDCDRIASDDEIMKLAELTGAKGVIDKQPRGLSEVVGTFSTTGNNLSGGQWQKIALTRAIYRKKSRIIILDEPTAALDPLAEAELYRDFTKITEDKTTILISHRLGVTSIVDRILVFDGGRIAEEGNHEALMKLGGIYAKMYCAQAKWYVN